MRKVLITGGSSGIGMAACETFLNAGYKVVVTGRNSERLETVSARHGGMPLVAEVCDALQPQAVQKLFERHADTDILINNAGIYGKSELAKATDEDFDSMFDINVKGLFRHCKEAIRTWEEAGKSGLILNVSSTLAQKPAPGTALYAASKAAVQSLTKSIAMEYAPRVRANAVLPGVIDTPIHTRALGREAAEAFLADAGGFHPLQRVGKPQEVADFLLYLCSDSAAWITGSDFVIDGGISLVC